MTKRFKKLFLGAFVCSPNEKEEFIYLMQKQYDEFLEIAKGLNKKEALESKQNQFLYSGNSKEILKNYPILTKSYERFVKDLFKTNNVKDSFEKTVNYRNIKDKYFLNFNTKYMLMYQIDFMISNMSRFNSYNFFTPLKCEDFLKKNKKHIVEEMDNLYSFSEDRKEFLEKKTEFFKHVIEVLNNNKNQLLNYGRKELNNLYHYIHCVIKIGNLSSIETPIFDECLRFAI